MGSTGEDQKVEKGAQEKVLLAAALKEKATAVVVIQEVGMARATKAADSRAAVWLVESKATEVTVA